jgi:copper chaperone
MKTTLLRVEGMACEHCENAVKKAVNALDGVTKTVVSLSEKIVTVEHDEAICSVERITDAIEDQGYDVVS